MSKNWLWLSVAFFGMLGVFIGMAIVWSTSDVVAEIIAQGVGVVVIGLGIALAVHTIVSEKKRDLQ